MKNIKSYIFFYLKKLVFLAIIFKKYNLLINTHKKSVKFSYRNLKG